MDNRYRLLLPYHAVQHTTDGTFPPMTLPTWGRKVLLLAAIPVPPENISLEFLMLLTTQLTSPAIPNKITVLIQYWPYTTNSIYNTYGQLC